MEKISVLIFIIASTFIQIDILPIFTLFNVKPDLLFIIAVFCILYFSFFPGLIFCLLCGLLKDIFSSGVFGLNLFSFAICFFILQKIKQYFEWDNYLIRYATVFLMCLINAILYALIKTVASDTVFTAAILVIIILESIYSAILSPIIFICFRKCVLKFSRY